MSRLLSPQAEVRDESSDSFLSAFPGCDKELEINGCKGWNVILDMVSEVSGPGNLVPLLESSISSMTNKTPPLI